MSEDRHDNRLAWFFAGFLAGAVLVGGGSFAYLSVQSLRMRAEAAAMAERADAERARAEAAARQAAAELARAEAEAKKAEEALKKAGGEE